MENKPNRQMKLSHILPGICSLLFVLLLIINFIAGYQYVSFSVSQDFSDLMTPYAIIGAAILTILFVWGFISVTNQFIKSKKRSAFGKFIYSLYIYLMFMLVIALIGYCFYIFFLKTPAEILHTNAEKEYFTMDVTIESVSLRTKRRFHPAYKYSASFTAEDYFDSHQTIMLTTDQRDEFFRGNDFPITVTLYGYKSEYGYDLYCCKDTMK